MTNSVSIIPISSLLLILIPVAVVLWIQYKWSLNYKEGIYAVSRMLGQLLIVGYFLGYIFNSDNAWIIVLILVVMVVASSWIALRTIAEHRKQFFMVVLISLLVGSASTLILVTQAVLDLVLPDLWKPDWCRPDQTAGTGGHFFHIHAGYPHIRSRMPTRSAAMVADATVAEYAAPVWMESTALAPRSAAAAYASTKQPGEGAAVATWAPDATRR